MYEIDAIMSFSKINVHGLYFLEHAKANFAKILYVPCGNRQSFSSCTLFKRMNINKTIQSAIENHQKGNLKEAESLYKKILKKQPDNPDILHMLGLLLCQRSNYDLAIHYIRKALQFRPVNVAQAYCHLGIAFQGKGLLDEAITSYQKALELDPSFAEASCNLGVALKEKDK